MFNFKKERLNTKKLLGTSPSGRVYPYQKDPLDTKWVVKHAITKDPKDVSGYFQEITSGLRCDSPYILPIKGYFIDHNEDGIWNIYIKFPRMENSLKKIMEDHKRSKEPIPEEKVVQYFYEITQGLRYLHKNGVAHWDIKPNNILIDEEGHTKIADFDLGNFIGDENLNSSVEKSGTVFYVAPENQNKDFKLEKKDLFRADCWSLGMILFEMCTLLDLRNIDLFSSEENIQADLEAKLLTSGKEYSSALLGLILSVLRYKASERRDLDEIIKTLEDEHGDLLIQDNPEELEKAQRKKRNLQGPEVKTENFERTENLGKSAKHTRQLKLKELLFFGFWVVFMPILLGLLIKAVFFASDGQQRIELGQKISDGRQRIELGQKISDGRQRIELGQKSFKILKNELMEKWGRFELQLSNKYSEAFVNFYPENYSDSEDTTGEDIADFLQDLALIYVQSDRRELKKLFLYGESFESTSRVNSIIQTIVKSFGWANLQNLSCLEIKISGHFITDETLEIVAKEIGTNLKNLHSLCLHFSNWGQYEQSEMTDKGVIALATHLVGALDNMTSIKFDFTNNQKVTDHGLNILATQIGLHHKNLLDLSLDFTDCSISDAGIKHLSNQLGANTKSLTVLHLFFQGCEEITNDSFTVLIDDIASNFKNMTYLYLNFRNTTVSEEQGALAKLWDPKDKEDRRQIIIFH